jgi:dolichol-phosphate mannosyltransferase
VTPSDAGLELSLVAPTYNERANVEGLLAKLEAALAGVRWEVIFVDDDSPDGTADAVKAIAARDPRVRCLRRVGRRGLAGAIVEGMLASSAPFVGVIDADLQHDETLLPRMLEALRSGQYDVAAGTRYQSAEGLQQGLSPIRKAGSQTATWLSRRALRSKISDPMGGFFMIRREVVERVAPKLSPGGYKLIFDIVATHRAPLRVADLPYAFSTRGAGESKMDTRVVVEYVGLLVAKLSGGLLTPAWAFAALALGVGLAAHMLVLALLIGRGFLAAQGAGAAAAIVAGFVVANIVAFRARRRGGLRLATGFVAYAALCALGVPANLALAVELLQHRASWPLAGLAGGAAGVVWNYVSTFLGVW